MKKALLLLVISGTAYAQEWVKTNYRDELHNLSGVQFALASKDRGSAIKVVCSAGKLEEAWLITNTVVDVQVKSNLVGQLSDKVDVEYRRDAEPKAHRMSLLASKDSHAILLQRKRRISMRPDEDTSGFEFLLYGPVGLGGGEWRRNKKANNWAKKLIVGISAYAESDAVFTFDVPDPSPVLQACGIK